MNKTEFNACIQTEFKHISSLFFDQVEKYKIFLQDYNQKINLTRLDTEPKIYGEYFYESIVPFKDLDLLKIHTLLDIGSGSGIPGMILKLLYPHLQLTIIESNRKKCLFLKKLGEHLNIDVSIINQRAEKIQNCHREQFDLVTSRAVGALPIMVELSLPYLKIGGLLVEPKSKKWSEELLVSQKIITALGGKLRSTNQFQSANDKFHAIFLIEKIKKTDPIYPRE